MDEPWHTFITEMHGHAEHYKSRVPPAQRPPELQELLESVESAWESLQRSDQRLQDLMKGPQCECRDRYCNHRADEHGTGGVCLVDGCKCGGWM